MMVTQRGTTTTRRNDIDNETLVETRVVMEELHRSNQAMQDNIPTLQERHHDDNPLEDDEVLDPRHLFEEIWGTPVWEKFKLLLTVKFDGTYDPYEHIASINTRMAIIGAYDSLKFKTLYNTFK